jgi:hypothetical protein
LPFESRTDALRHESAHLPPSPCVPPSLSLPAPFATAASHAVSAERELPASTLAQPPNDQVHGAGAEVLDEA